MHILTIYGDELYHHGIPGQKWGLRRFQNKDGSYTDAGLKRRAREYKKTLNKADTKAARATARLASLQRSKKGYFSPEKRAARRAFEGKDTKKLMEKVQKRNIREKELAKTIKDNDRIIKDTLKKCKDEGFEYAVRKVQKYSWADFNLSEGYYQSAYSNSFRVRPSNEKTKKSAYWQTNRDVNKRTPVRTNTYYY